MVENVYGSVFCALIVLCLLFIYLFLNFSEATCIDSESQSYNLIQKNKVRSSILSVGKLFNLLSFGNAMLHRDICNASQSTANNMCSA